MEVMFYTGKKTINLSIHLMLLVLDKDLFPKSYRFPDFTPVLISLDSDSFACISVLKVYNVFSVNTVRYAGWCFRPIQTSNYSFKEPSHISLCLTVGNFVFESLKRTVS